MPLEVGKNTPLGYLEGIDQLQKRNHTCEHGVYFTKGMVFNFNFYNMHSVCTVTRVTIKYKYFNNYSKNNNQQYN